MTTPLSEVDTAAMTLTELVAMRDGLRQAWRAASADDRPAIALMGQDLNTLIAERRRVGYVSDVDFSVEGSHPCGRCAGTGQFITGMLNGKPTGPGGPCFRCGGKGYHTRDDRRRNDYHDTHRTV